LRTGQALTPPAYEPIRVFETKLADGRLWVRAD
jgi:nitrite reductase/ring-hydroxylating ferredoxin subunit